MNRKTRNRLLSVVGSLLASLALAGETPATFSYNGQPLEMLSQKALEREDLVPGLSVVTGYPSTGSLKVSWVTRTNTHIATTLSLWEGSCQRLSSSQKAVLDRRTTQEALVLFEADMKLTQIGNFCWVAHGSEAQQLDVMSRLLAIPADQALPPRERPTEWVNALAQLNAFMKSPALQQTGTSRFNGLSAGQWVNSPEQAASLAGFTEAKVAARASGQGVGYLLHCGPTTVLGQAGLVTLSRTTNRVNQFAAYLTAAEAPAALNRILRDNGKPAREIRDHGRSGYLWFSGEFTTGLEQQDDGSWLYSWGNTSCPSGGC